MEKTTITVSEGTRRELEELKRRKNIRSFDKLLSNIARKELKVPNSMFGAIPGVKKLSEEGGIREHDDRTDRILRTRR